MTEKFLFTKAEAAEAIGISARSVDYLIAAGRLPSRKVGKRRLVPRGALEKFAAKDQLEPISGGARQ
jgi:excisionase family DNA binding protein